MVGSPQGVARQGHATVETEMQADETDPWTTMGAGAREGPIHGIPSNGANDDNKTGSCL